jgi:phosphoserine phosphatase
VTGPLPGWNDGETKNSIIGFVEQVCGRGTAKAVPAQDRVAVFDNDGTLWCEKPMPVQLDFILRRLVEMVQQDDGLRGRQPWKAACEKDYGWIATAIDEHYAGDDTLAMTLLAGILAAYDGISVEEFEARSDAFLRSAQHPTLGCGYLETSYAPMVELLAYLETNGFSNYVVSGGGRDFIRPVTQDLYGIPRERVMGSASTLEYVSDQDGGTLTHQAKADYLDDGKEKPVRIWSRTGRRPILAAGNSNGDVPMLEFAQHEDKPSLRLVVLHDDQDREFDYVSGADQALERAAEGDWTVVSIRNDWSRVF